MRKHQHKKITEVLEYAQEQGWSIQESRGRSWGKVSCPYNDNKCRKRKYCLKNVYTTPKNPENKARELKRIIQNCIHFQE